MILAVSTTGKYAFQLLKGPANSIIYFKFISDLIDKLELKPLVMISDDVPFHKTLLMQALYTMKCCKVIFTTRTRQNKTS